ncbi:hypothetical protein BQ8794_320098 [Mesorhizobium prunaredense]|uniref:Uncharacterized protein n=1 Tax=Mesorhizobium prunaredense TaxID=1631249 RepID=A0A1R3VBG5_9HYPH|nr:hypothetical protein BQ8794_320098 [Mesorhizobium prunaredense]
MTIYTGIAQRGMRWMVSDHVTVRTSGRLSGPSSNVQMAWRGGQHPVRCDGRSFDAHQSGASARTASSSP